jgi:hypothetical protein
LPSKIPMVSAVLLGESVLCILRKAASLGKSAYIATFQRPLAPNWCHIGDDTRV